MLFPVKLNEKGEKLFGTAVLYNGEYEYFKGHHLYYVCPTLSPYTRIVWSDSTLTSSVLPTLL